jgi:Holliday junction resolvase
MGGAMSRNKGRNGETQLVHVLETYGYKVRRGAAFLGEPDILGIPGLHIECKRVERLNLEAAMDQSKRDAKPGEVPVVMHRKNRRPWVVTLSLDDFMRLWGRANGA